MRTDGRPERICRREMPFRLIVRSPEKFDAPSPLAEFGLDRPPMSWQYVEIPDGMEAEHE